MSAARELETVDPDQKAWEILNRKFKPLDEQLAATKDSKEIERLKEELAPLERQLLKLSYGFKVLRKSLETYPNIVIPKVIKDDEKAISPANYAFFSMKTFQSCLLKLVPVNAEEAGLAVLIADKTIAMHKAESLRGDPDSDGYTLDAISRLRRIQDKLTVEDGIKRGRVLEAVQTLFQSYRFKHGKGTTSEFNKELMDRGVHTVTKTLAGK